MSTTAPPSASAPVPQVPHLCALAGGQGWGARIITFLLGLGTLLYILLAAGCAIYLLARAYKSEIPASDFEKLAVAALIAVVGTGFTAMAAIYGATRQSATAYQVQLLSSDTSRLLAEYNAAISTQLTTIKTNADTTLAKLKENSEQALAKLKVGLDSGQLAYRELFGAANGLLLWTSFDRSRTME